MTERWKATRRVVNTLLRVHLIEKNYHDVRAEHGVESPISGKQRQDLKQAVELRRQVYRCRKEMIEQGL